MTLIIGFGNKSRNGKDTAAEAIKSHFNWVNSSLKVGIFKFAGALYAEVNEFLKTPSGELFLNRKPGDYVIADSVRIPDWVVPDPNPEISTLAPYGKHPKLLQWWGTEYRRNNFGQDYWVNKMFDSIPTDTDIALVTDVRFPNEADAIKAHGGYNVNVTRLNDDGTQFYDTQRPMNHISEIALDGYNWDYYLTVRNNVDYLQYSARNLAEYLKVRN